MSLVFIFKCSTSCGVGRKTRVVTCVTEGVPCDLSEKPEAHETCDLGPCLAKSTPLNVVSAKLQNPQWLFTEWSDQVSCLPALAKFMRTKSIVLIKNWYMISSFLILLITY